MSVRVEVPVGVRNGVPPAVPVGVADSVGVREAVALSVGVAEAIGLEVVTGVELRTGVGDPPWVDEPWAAWGDVW